ncbi:MAG: NAD(P)/FAD-dependent oxidoreductase [Bacteroidota bacterium]
MEHYNIVIVGGGAAGFFAAINIAEMAPDLSVCILERGKEGLQKVKVSGGGRCNVTHAEFIPSELILNYPRGERELLGPFHTFMTGDTIEWFEMRGVQLKIEEDGRMFPITDSSRTIIDCFLNEAQRHNVEIKYGHAVKQIQPRDQGFEIETSQSILSSEKIVIATGSNTKIWNLLATLGHNIIPPTPSLFTFNIKDERIKDIPGVVVKDVEVKVLGTNLVSEGPLLITHVGMSAPAILKLSAFGAIELAKHNYDFKIEINFVRQSYEDCLSHLIGMKQKSPKKTVSNSVQFGLPKRLWKRLVESSGIVKSMNWADCSKPFLVALTKQLTKAIFHVTGKSTFKEEFVTAGGVDLKDINFKTFESKLLPNMYFAGEVINVDAVTGGFNFQNAWTGAYIAAKSITSQ